MAKLFMIAFLLLSSWESAKAETGAPSLEDKVRRVEQSLAPTNVAALYRFTNTRTDGTTTEYEVRFEMRDVNHSHGAFQKPEREKGREVLRIEDNLWTYIPNVGRIVRIADRDSFAGGDFSNADILRADWTNKYSIALLKDLPSQEIVEMIAKTPAAPYAKMRLWLDKKSGQPVQQNYYDSSGTLLKRCLYGNTKTFGSITRPSELQMENAITKQKSRLEILDLKTEQKIPDSRFIVDNLGK